MNIVERMNKIEALIERAGTEGERQSAILAKERLLKHKSEEEIEYTIHTNDMWHKKLFNALCHKHNLKPYRYYRQKYTTVMVMISKTYLDETLWPEYLQFSKLLQELVDDITLEVITKIHKNEDEIVIQGEIEVKT